MEKSKDEIYEELLHNIEKKGLTENQLANHYGVSKDKLKEMLIAGYICSKTRIKGMIK